MPLESLPPPAPGAARGPRDEAELLGQCGGIARRSGAHAAGSERIAADIKMTAETGELGVLEIAPAFFHQTLPALETSSHIARRRRFPLHRRSPLLALP